jgi:hypothetical protein
MNMSKFGFQPAKLQLLAVTEAHIEPVTRNVPDRYSVPWPSYEFRALSEIFALPSMNIVPLSESVFVVAFHARRPLVGVFHTTVWEFTWAAAVLPFTPRVTVQVVVPNPPVTVIDSSSIRIVNGVVGKPVAEATVSVVCVAFMAAVSVVFAPGPTRQ